MLANDHHFPLGALRQNLQRLVIIRFIVILAQLVAVMLSYFTLKLAVNYHWISIIIGCQIGINMLVIWRLQKSWPITTFEFFCQLVFDILGLSALLYLSGGASNPFVSYYLVPITISAALLPWRFTWTISTLSLLLYTLLLYYFIPLDELAPHSIAHTQHSSGHHLAHDGSINLHILGMWLNFAISAILITYFVVKMAQALRDQNELINTVKEERLRDEQILTIATLAAGTAHEMGTPLSTLMVLLSDMKDEYADNENLHKDITTLLQQVSLCKSTLKKLVSTANMQQHTETQTVSVSDFIHTIIDQWKIIRPEVTLDLTITTQASAPNIKTDATLGPAVLNLLNNAADASPENIAIELSWSQQTWQLEIRDYGSGIPAEMIDQLGQAFITTKGKGLGIGLTISHASISRLGGTIKLYNHQDGGTLTTIVLPIR